MKWFARLPLLLAFGICPMIVYYGANGMAEAVYLYFLVVGVYFLMRWNPPRRTHFLAFVGTALALALLSRYEIMPFVLVIAAGIAAITLAGREQVYRPQELEGSLLLYLAPIAYAGSAWIFFNWLIIGDPLGFLGIGPTTADVGTSQQDIAGLAARDLGASEIVQYLITLNLGLFPLAVLVVPALLVTAVVKRDLMSLVLTALVVTNAAVAGLLFIQTSDPNLVQLRYNMRAIPLALIAVAWLYYVWKNKGMRVGSGSRRSPFSLSRFRGRSG